MSNEVNTAPPPAPPEPPIVEPVSIRTMQAEANSIAREVASINRAVEHELKTTPVTPQEVLDMHNADLRDRRNGVASDEGRWRRRGLGSNDTPPMVGAAPAPAPDGSGVIDWRKLDWDILNGWLQRSVKPSFLTLREQIVETSAGISRKMVDDVVDQLEPVTQDLFKRVKSLEAGQVMLPDLLARIEALEAEVAELKKANEKRGWWR
jgi:hypothetical protein